MKVTILHVKDSGHISKERIVLKVLSQVDIGKFILCDTTYNPDGSVSNKLRHTFWFPDGVINQGDFVTVYTAKGTDRQYENKSGTVTHCFFWGLEKTIWNASGDGAVLFEVSEWAVKDVISKD